MILPTKTSTSTYSSLLSLVVMTNGGRKSIPRLRFGGLDLTALSHDVDYSCFAGDGG
jgi:hypothetical protein